MPSGPTEMRTDDVTNAQIGGQLFGLDLAYGPNAAVEIRESWRLKTLPISHHGQTDIARDGHTTGHRKREIR